MNQAQIPGKERRSYVYKVNLELIQHFCFVSITLAPARHQEWFLMHSTKTTRAEIDQMDVLTRSKNVQGALNIHKYTESNIEGIINPWEHTTPLFSCRFPSSADEDPLVPWSKGRNREDKRVLHQQKKNSFQTSKHLETESRASFAYLYTPNSRCLELRPVRNRWLVGTFSGRRRCFHSERRKGEKFWN